MVIAAICPHGPRAKSETYPLLSLHESSPHPDHQPRRPLPPIPAPSPQLMSVGDHPRAGGGEGVTVGDEPPSTSTFIYLTGGLRQPAPRGQSGSLANTGDSPASARQKLVRIDQREIASVRPARSSASGVDHAGPGSISCQTSMAVKA